MTSQDNPYLQILRNLIRNYVENYQVKVYLFGSRAKDTAHKLSDVDIAILPLQPLPSHFMTNLKEAIEESTLPYSVDIVDLSKVDLPFREKILAEGIEWKD